MILRARHIQKSYQQGARQIDILNGVDFEVEEASTVSIMGQSGSGKSTLISILAALETPTSGELKIAGQDILKMSSSALAAFRARHIGVIFQQFHLLPHLTAWENVRLPLDFVGDPQAATQAHEVLKRLGLEHRADHYPSEMSRGECQRVAIGRVLVMRPPVVFADEPTGSLDLKTAGDIMSLIFEVTRSEKIALIMATHDPQIAALCDQQYMLRAGHLHLLSKPQQRLVTRDDL